MLHLVRHGRTAVNAAGRLQGRIDEPLDEVGEAQAAGVGARPELTRVVRVVSSPLQRCRSTAAAIAAAAGVEVEVDERLIELDYGSLDGTLLAEVPASVWTSWRADPGWKAPGGESLVDVGERVASLLSALAAAPPAGDVVLVSHVSPIKAAVAWALGVDDRVSFRIRLDPASICRIAVDGGRSVVHAVNDTSHL